LQLASDCPCVKRETVTATVATRFGLRLREQGDGYGNSFNFGFGLRLREQGDS
jgi:hypothetical protein